MISKKITELTGATTEEQLIRYLIAIKEYALLGEKVKNNVDYYSIVCDLEEIYLNEPFYHLGYSFEYTQNSFWTSISFNNHILWDSGNESYDHRNDCDWITETLLEHCKEEFNRYVEILNRMNGNTTNNR